MRRLAFISFVLFTLWNADIYSQTDTLSVVAFGNSTTAHRKGVDKVYSVRLHETLDYVGIHNKFLLSPILFSPKTSISDCLRYLSENFPPHMTCFRELKKGTYGNIRLPLFI